ncbi:MAG: RsmD family RNA methyltransferase [Candidatus Heimdallarchaeaceae archaeon]
MKTYLAFICGHFLPIGYEEFYACLEAEEIEHRIVNQEEQIIVFETEKDPTVAAARCAFLHALILLTDVGEIVEDKVQFNSEYDQLEIESNKSFAVRVRKIGRKEVKFRSVDLERILGKHIFYKFEEAKLEADLQEPYYPFLAVLIKKKLFLGLELWSQDRKKYAIREPGEREYFRPGAMRTDFARAIVNLSRVKQGDTFFDPFCGGGGFLLEAFELGAYSIGSDLDGFAIQGSKENLTQFKNFNTSIYRGDSRYLAVKQVDAIATDPPYSTQSSTHGLKLADLVYDFLIDSRKVLKPDRFLVFSTPASVAPEKIVEKTDFKLVTLIDCVIHKSLTRRILVLK